MIMLKRGGEPGYTMVELLVAIALAGLMGSAVAAVYQVSQQSYTRASSMEAAQLGVRAGLDRMASELRLIGSFWVGANGAGTAITAATSTSITFMASVDDSSVINGAEATVSSTASGNSVPLTAAAIATDAFRCYTNPALNDYIYIASGGTRDVRQIASINGNTTCNNANNNTIGLASALSSPYPVPPDTNVQNVLVRDVKRITYTRNTGNKTLTRTQGGSGADPFIDNVTGLTFTYYDTTGGALGPNPTLSAIREIQVDLTVQVQGLDSIPRRMTTRVRPRSLPS